MKSSTVKIIPDMVFGKLTVIKYYGKNIKGHSSLWECSCECGSVVIVNGGSLKRGDTSSCGCGKRELVSKMFTTHGLSRHRLYTIYKGMKQRCGNVNNNSYKDYGERGIGICNEWLDDFINFFNWATMNGYSDNLTIERVDNNKGYSPDNCKWIPKAYQAENRRCNHELTFNGETKTISEWSRGIGGNFNLVYRRIERGWDLREALTTNNHDDKKRSWIMKSLGIIIKIDKFGRIILPSELRKSLGYGPETPLEILADSKGLYIKKHSKGCMFCGSDDKVVAWHRDKVCRACASDILAKGVKEGVVE